MSNFYKIAIFFLAGSFLLVLVNSLSDKRDYEKDLASTRELVYKADSATLAVRDSLLTIIAEQDSTISYLNSEVKKHTEIKRDNYKRKFDSIYPIAVRSNYKLERLRYYVAICDKTPSNKVFFFGWVKNRVLMK